MGVRNGINLYAGYQRLQKKKKSAGSKNFLVFAPLVVLFAVLLAVAARLLISNLGRAAELNQLLADRDAMAEQYAVASALSERSNSAEGEYQGLYATNFIADLYPELSREMMETVQACAGEIFQLDSYSFDSSTGLLQVNANADSVNEVPKFIARLRNTKLFYSVYYTGYTSDTTGRYYCTVGCQVVNPEEEALALADAQPEEDDQTETAEPDTAGETGGGMSDYME